jgi:hypothetical protein
MEYLAKHRLVENYFQLYINFGDESISLVIAIIQFKNKKNSCKSHLIENVLVKKKGFSTSVWCIGSHCVHT